MKKIAVLALAAAAAMSAQAQSSVTLFGLVDLSVNSVKNGSVSQKSMDSAGLNTSRLGFRGVEDLGGGMTAGFHLEAGLNPDTGAAGGSVGNSNTGFFNRRSTVSLNGSFGEVRLGRDYNVGFNVASKFDAFGANGFGTAYNLYNGKAVALNTKAGDSVARINNAVSYFLPGKLGGVYGQLQVGAPEGVAGNGYKGGMIGYAAGPVDVAVSFSQIDVFGTEKYKVANIGASYNFGVVKVYGLYDQRKYLAQKHTTYELSASVPLGQGEFRAAYAALNAEGGTAAFNGSDAKLFGFEYIYNLSKRTAVYAQTGRLTNDGASALTLGGAATTATGFKSTAYGAGVRHTF